MYFSVLCQLKLYYLSDLREDFIVDAKDGEDADEDATEDSTFDNYEELLDREDEEVMLVDHNLEAVLDQVAVLAPGQGKKPLPWLIHKHIDELCFSRIFGGQKMELPANITYTDRSKSETMRVDRHRRSTEPSRLFFMAK